MMKEPIKQRLKEAGEELDARADAIVTKGEEKIAQAKKSKWTAGFLAAGTAIAAIAAFLIIK
jgi:hypothetical protein